MAMKPTGAAPQPQLGKGEREVAHDQHPTVDVARALEGPGGLLQQIEKLSAAGINVEYLYAFASTSANEARVVIKVDNLERAERIVNGEKPAAAAGKEKGDVPGFYW